MGDGQDAPERALEIVHDHVGEVGLHLFQLFPLAQGALCDLGHALVFLGERPVHVAAHDVRVHGNTHVQEHDLAQRAEQIENACGVGVVRAQPLDDQPQVEVVGAEVPVRLQLDTLMGVADAQSMLEVVGIELRLRHAQEVGALQLLEPSGLGGITEKRLQFGKARQIRAEVLDDLVRLGAGELMHRAQIVPVTRREFQEFKPALAVRCIQARVFEELHFWHPHRD